MSTTLGQAMRDVLAMLNDGLEAAGVAAHAAADPADVDGLPAVLVYPNTVGFDTLDGQGYTLSVDVALVAGGVPALVALDQLDELMAATRAAVGAGQLPDWRAATVNLPNHSGAQLPALISTVSFSVTDD